MDQKSTEQSSESNYRLLLVEDNPAHARLVTEMLRGTPCEAARITHVTTLTDALLRVGIEPFDLVLLDLGLPESRGMETFLRFHAEAPLQPVVVLTSLDDAHLALEIVKAGAEDYLPKEEMSGSLCRTVRHAIERAQLASRLLEREQQLRTILNRNLDGLAVVDPLGHTQYANAAAQKMLGVDGVERLTAHIQSTSDLEKPTILAFDPDEGAPIVAEVRTASITWDHQQSYLVSLRDITLRRQIEKNLLQTQKMEMIGTLSSGIAHDFNNILSAISGYAQLLAADQESERYDDLKEDISCILDAVGRGNFLVRDLLHLGRPREIERYLVNLNDLLRKTEKLVAATIRKTHKLRFAFPEIACYINASPENLEQVFINLIMNARDATQEKGELEVQLSPAQDYAAFSALNGEAPEGQYVCVVIRDNGSGIAPEIYPRMFEPFFTTKEVGKGTGLGMFVVSGIVEQHAGWIVCDTAAGKGTAFHLYFPNADPDVV